MAVNTHRTRSPDLFSYGMVQYVLGVSIHNTEIAGKQVLWTWELEPDGKSSIFPPWNLDHCSLKLARKTFWFISLFIKTTLVMYLSFLKVISCLPFLAEKSSDSTLLAKQGKNRSRCHHTWIIPWVLGINLQSFETTERWVLWTWNWGMISKISHLPCETYRVAACNLSETYTGSFYSSILEPLL